MAELPDTHGKRLCLRVILTQLTAELVSSDNAYGPYVSCVQFQAVVEFNLHPDKARDKSALPEDNTGPHPDKTANKSFIRVKTPDKKSS